MNSTNSVEKKQIIILLHIRPGKKNSYDTSAILFCGVGKVASGGQYIRSAELLQFITTCGDLMSVAEWRHEGHQEAWQATQIPRHLAVLNVTGILCGSAE
ncbi:hypothetical protein R5R35_010457 [Gryllus longicercus]|uniref:Uncharacterized protein n=1 Tax=Gryllus longicercus TaxID=2509291 RepID=A0AAN9Z7D9_9ORTH